jgi:hypothetical protein
MSAAPCSCEEAEALKARVAEVEAERDALRAALEENIGVKGACEVCWRKSMGDGGFRAGECNKCKKARLLLDRSRAAVTPGSDR